MTLFSRARAVFPRRGNARAIAMIVATAAICFVIYAVQAYVPIAGVIMMMFAGPIWVNLPIHGCMIGLALYAWRREIPWGWIALPIAFYAGGVAMFAISLADAQ